MIPVVTEKKTINCQIRYKKLKTEFSPAALSQIFAQQNLPSILGGNPSSRFSYWASEPKETFKFETTQNKPFDKLHKAINKYVLSRRPDELPEGIFCGGWCGFFSYELGRFIEKIPQTVKDDLNMPLIYLSFYDAVICFDNVKNDIWLIALESNEGLAEEKLSRLENMVLDSKQLKVAGLKPADIEAVDTSRFETNMDKQYYLDAIKKIKRYIYDGDTYQINFSRRFNCDFSANPIDLFQWQNRYNPSPYSAYIDYGSGTIISASPELFISLVNGIILTKPIKGTRPRLKETSKKETMLNRGNFDELLHSEKDKAELNMIIDLERNDLGRICKYGSIKVVQPRTIEQYPTVFHAVATVRGQLRPEIEICDILKAMFPGGWITGAPKIRSMEIIDETEPTARGIYTGSIGFIGIDGTVCLNIAIRTIIISGKRAYAQTGGGIVADSDQQLEYDESLTKARALLAGIISV